MKRNTKWISNLLEIEKSIPTIEKREDYKILLDQFESIDIDYRDQFAPHLYLKMWKVALRSGKINLSHTYAKKAFQHLIEYKRIPQIQILIKSLKEEGLFNKNYNELVVIENIILGKKLKITNEDLKRIDLYIDHPDHWKYSPEFLAQSLLLDEDWNIEQWKRCYEYILIYKFNKHIFLALLGKTIDFKNKKAEADFLKYLNDRKIKIPLFRELDNAPKKVPGTFLHVDYDQIAMEIISGSLASISEEQKRVISSLKFISDEELLRKGQDMIVAFELLGMEQVVLVLCEKMVKITSDVKELAKTYYVWGQALSNIGEYYKCIDLIDDALKSIPLYQEEQLAFAYLKAEACFKLKKIKIAKELYLEIKKINPHYRLVKERLETIETT